jgi:hypothetical protein
MRAKLINEFKQGGDPYKKLGIGKYCDPRIGDKYKLNRSIIWSSSKGWIPCANDKSSISINTFFFINKNIDSDGDWELKSINNDDYYKIYVNDIQFKKYFDRI